MSASGRYRDNFCQAGCPHHGVFSGELNLACQLHFHFWGSLDLQGDVITSPKPFFSWKSLSLYLVTMTVPCERSALCSLPQRNVPDNQDSESPALSTCSNADIFRRMNTMLGNALDFTGVCTTPTSAKQKPEPLCGKEPSPPPPLPFWDLSTEHS